MIILSQSRKLLLALLLWGSANTHRWILSTHWPLGNLDVILKMQFLILFYWLVSSELVNTLRPRQNGRYFADDIFKCIFLNENVWIVVKISLKFVPKGPINNIPALVQIMAWGRPGDMPLSEPRMISLPTHRCVTGPQWVKVMPSDEYHSTLVMISQHWFS